MESNIHEFIKGCSRAGGTLKTANRGERILVSEPNTREWEEETRSTAERIDNELGNVLLCEGIDPENSKSIAAVPNPDQEGDIISAEIRTRTGRERITNPRIDGSNSADEITIHSHEKTIGFRNGEREETKPMMAQIDEEVSAEIMSMEDGQKASRKMRKQTEEALAQMDEGIRREQKQRQYKTKRANYELDRNGRGEIL